MLNKIIMVPSLINTKLFLKIMTLSVLLLSAGFSAQAQDSSQQVRVPNNVLSGEELGDFAPYRP